MARRCARGAAVQRRRGRGGACTEALRRAHAGAARRRSFNRAHRLFSSPAQAELAGADAYAALVAACGGGDDGAALADWFALCRCDALAISNSTFSFSAAMLAAHVAGDAAFVAARPDPRVGAMASFDPWDAPSTLNVRDAVS